MNKMFVSAIIPAAGFGLRMGGRREKQFLNLAGQPILIHTLKTFEKSDLINEIILVLPPHKVKTFKRKYRFNKLGKVVPGGKTRQQSVGQGLKEVSPNCEFVVIHDGVRPLFTETLLKRVIRAARRYGAAIPVINCPDAIKFIEKGFVKTTPPREKLQLVQTPQVFEYKLLVKAHQKASRERFFASDDAGLIEYLGKKVKVIPGEEENIKITTPQDLQLARLILKKR